MQLAILHYHLNRGGVTRVIENQLRALDGVLQGQAPWSVALIHGGRRQGWPDRLAAQLKSIRLTLHDLPPLDYDAFHQRTNRTVGSLPDELTALLAELAFAPGDSVIHVHNYALGKNVQLPAAVSMLAEQGYRMVLQPHDFAEDFRPANFQWLAQHLADQSGPCWHGRLYPQAAHVHYALLNGRDYEILETAGVEPQRLHLLPNPVPALDHLPPRDQARQRLAEQFRVGPQDPLALYPVRGIRRKNLGEALLYGYLAPPGTVIGLTLPPLNPIERETYAGWKQLAAELGLPCRFGLGAAGGLRFAENLAAADLILTTSLAEGFGMVFLESWLAGRALVGRDLPEITADFTRAGVRLDSLQPWLHVPSEWLAPDALRETIREAYCRTLSAYGRPQPADIAVGLEAKTGGECVDFGDLDEPLQRQVISTVARSPQNRRRLLQCNPGIERALSMRADQAAELIRENTQAINRRFSLQPSGRRLLELYRRVADSPREEHPKPLEHAGRILDQLLSLKRFRLIRT